MPVSGWIWLTIVPCPYWPVSNYRGPNIPAPAPLIMGAKRKGQPLAPGWPFHFDHFPIGQAQSANDGEINPQKQQAAYETPSKGNQRAKQHAGN